MAARATSSGTISFGLVSIPIKVYTATSSKNVRFNMLHESDNSRLKQQLICATCGEVVERNATVKGYEYARGQYVVMTDEELKKYAASDLKEIKESMAHIATNTKVIADALAVIMKQGNRGPR